MLRTTVLTAALTSALVVGSAGAAAAHECFIAKRSATGTAAAGHSANWYVLQVSDTYADAHFFAPIQPMTPEQVAAAVRLTAERGIPTSFALFERFTIPRNLEDLHDLEQLPAKSADGKGVDHLSGYVGALVGIATEVGTPA